VETLRCLPLHIPVYKLAPPPSLIFFALQHSFFFIFNLVCSFTSNMQTHSLKKWDFLRFSCFLSLLSFFSHAIQHRGWHLFWISHEYIHLWRQQRASCIYCLNLLKNIFAKSYKLLKNSRQNAKHMCDAILWSDRLRRSSSHERKRKNFKQFFHHHISFERE
jgi:hypothetical protein